MDIEKSNSFKAEILKLQENEEDKILNISLRPDTLSDFIGQEAVVRNLKIALQAARQRKDTLEHVLFSGPPGLGKTSLAHIVAHEMESKITATSGPAIERAGDLIGILTNLNRTDILFIDEIHRLSRVVEEFLYQAMENFQIDFVIDKGPYAKTIKFNLKPFTLIGATTRSGSLSAPLRSRFGLFFHLDFYNESELSRIVLNSAKVLGFELDKEAAVEIGSRSRGTPRIANRMLRRVRDYAQVHDQKICNKATACKALEQLNIDPNGLDQLDMKVLKAVIKRFNGGPVGIDSLAATLNEDVETLTDCVEPFLLKAGYLTRTARGREATALSYSLLGEKPSKQAGEKELF